MHEDVRGGVVPWAEFNKPADAGDPQADGADMGRLPAALHGEARLGLPGPRATGQPRAPGGRPGASMPPQVHQGWGGGDGGLQGGNEVALVLFLILIYL